MRSSTGCLARSHALRGEALEAPHSCRVAGKGGRKPRHGVAPRAALAVEDRLARCERRRRIRPRPRIGERERRRVGSRSHEVFDLALSDRLAGRPGRDLLDLGRQRVRDPRRRGGRARRTHRPRPARRSLREALRHPLGETPSSRTAYSSTSPTLGARLSERRVLLHLLADERQHGRRSRCARYSTTAAIVGGLPPAGQPSVRSATPVDVLDDDESSVPEQAARVAERDRVGGASPRARRRARRPRARSAGEAGRVPSHLRSVAAGDQVDGLELDVRHAPAYPPGGAGSESAPLGGHRKPLAVGLDDDAAVDIGAEEAEAGHTPRAPRPSPAAGGRSRSRRPPR